MPVWLCVCAGVAVVSRRFCAALTYVKLHLHLHLCLALLCVLSRGSAPPCSYLPSCLNCGPQCRDPLTFTHNREITSAPPITHSASHPAEREHTVAAHPTISMTARGLSTHVTQRHATKMSFRARLGADTNSFTLATIVVTVATGSGSHGDDRGGTNSRIKQ